MSILSSWTRSSRLFMRFCQCCRGGWRDGECYKSHWFALFPLWAHGPVTYYWRVLSTPRRVLATPPIVCSRATPSSVHIHRADVPWSLLCCISHSWDSVSYAILNLCCLSRLWGWGFGRLSHWFFRWEMGVMVGCRHCWMHVDLVGLLCHPWL